MNSTRYQTLELGDNDGQYRDVDTDRDASSSKNEQVLKYFRGVLIVTFASTLLLLGFWAGNTVRYAIELLSITITLPPEQLLLLNHFPYLFFYSILLIIIILLFFCLFFPYQ